jgi:hypothetical protein
MYQEANNEVVSNEVSIDQNIFTIVSTIYENAPYNTISLLDLDNKENDHVMLDNLYSLNTSSRPYFIHYATVEPSFKYSLKKNADLLVGFHAEQDTTFTFCVDHMEFNMTIKKGEFSFAFNNKIIPLLMYPCNEIYIKKMSGELYAVYATLENTFNKQMPLLPDICFKVEKGVRTILPVNPQLKETYVENKYVMFLEKNFKEGDHFIFYLQYNSNEYEITKLKNILDKADFDELYGDVSYFYIDTDNFISQIAVMEHVANKTFGNWGPMFQVCNGKMTFNDEEYKDLSPINLAKKLDTEFYHCRIKDLFE